MPVDGGKRWKRVEECLWMDNAEKGVGDVSAPYIEIMATNGDKE